MKLALGALQYYWSKQTVFDFYEHVADMPIDIVYLGETVCARRHQIRLDDWFRIAEKLTQAGKQVILTTQVLLESGAHMQQMHAIAQNAHYEVLANDMGAVGMLENKVPFIAGAHLNLYHTQAVSMMAQLGAKRWMAPFEMSEQTLQDIMDSLGNQIETEVYVFGRMPLAYSARCFTARYHNLPKDDCQFSCMNYPHGLEARTQENTEFIVFNGIQTLSCGVCNLIGQIQKMQQMGVSVVRISPQMSHMNHIAQIFSDVINHRIDVRDADGQLRQWLLAKPCNGYWFGTQGMAYVE